MSAVLHMAAWQTGGPTFVLRKQRYSMGAGTPAERDPAKWGEMQWRRAPFGVSWCRGIEET